MIDIESINIETNPCFVGHYNKSDPLAASKLAQGGLRSMTARKYYIKKLEDKKLFTLQNSVKCYEFLLLVYLMKVVLKMSSQKTRDSRSESAHNFISDEVRAVNCKHLENRGQRTQDRAEGPLFREAGLNFSSSDEKGLGSSVLGPRSQVFSLLFSVSKPEL